MAEINSHSFKKNSYNKPFLEVIFAWISLKG